MAKEGEVQRERDLNLQLQDEKYLALSRFEGAKDRVEALEKDCELLITEIQSSKLQVQEMKHHAEVLTSQKSLYQRKGEELGRDLD